MTAMGPGRSEFMIQAVAHLSLGAHSEGVAVASCADSGLRPKPACWAARKLPCLRKRWASMNPHVWLLIGLEREWGNQMKLTRGYTVLHRSMKQREFAPASKKSPTQGWGLRSAHV